MTSPFRVVYWCHSIPDDVGSDPERSFFHIDWETYDDYAEFMTIDNCYEIISQCAKRQGIQVDDLIKPCYGGEPVDVPNLGKRVYLS